MIRRSVVACVVAATAVVGGCRSAEAPSDVDDAGPTTSVAPAATPGTDPPTPTTESTTPSCSDAAPGLHEISLEAGGATHPVRIVVPGALGGGRLPVVIGFHGLGSNGAELARISGHERLADDVGLIAVHPTGVPDGDDSRAGWQLDRSPDDSHDDLAFAAALIDELVAEWCADPSRVYVTGLSNGGFFTARLVCDLSEQIAAAVSVAGMFRADGCAPARAVPYLAFHGTADEFIPFDGNGESVLLGDQPSVMPPEFFATDMPSTFRSFASGAGCDPTSVDSVLDVQAGDTMIRHAYPGCAGGVAMAFIEVVDGRHTWPGAQGVTPTALDATIDGWAFMNRFTLTAA